MNTFTSDVERILYEGERFLYLHEHILFCYFLENFSHGTKKSAYIMAPTSRKEFSHDLREVVIKRYLYGDSERDIARDLLISRNAVHYMIAKCKSTKCIGNLIGRGRKRKTTAHLDRVTQRKIKINRRRSTLAVKTELQTEFNITVSESTILRRVHEIGLYGRVARKKPLVTKAKRGKRVRYTRKYQEKPLGFWNSVLWSDESKFS